jgi:hypothetical protein
VIAASLQRLRCAPTAVARPGFVGAAFGLTAALYGVLWLVAFGTRAAAGSFGVAFVTSFILAWIAAPSLALTARAARQFCLPGLSAYARRLLWAIIFFLVIAPWLLSLASGFGSPWWRLAVLCCIVAASFVFVLAPLPLAVCLTFIPAMLGKLPALSGWVTHLGPRDHPGSTARLCALSLVFTLIAVAAWRKLILAEHLSPTFSASLAERLGADPMLMSRPRYDSNAMALQMPRWLLPRSSARAARGAIARMRTVLGPPFAAGWLLRQLAYLLMIVPVFILITPAIATDGPMAPGLLNICAIVMVQFLLRLMAVYRRNSPELAELALLPGCGSGQLWRRDYVTALLIPSLQVALVFGALSSQPLYAALAGALTFLMTFCLQTLVTLYCIVRGRMPIQNMIGGMALWLAIVLIVIGPLARIGAAALTSSPTERALAVIALASLVAGHAVAVAALVSRLSAPVSTARSRRRALKPVSIVRPEGAGPSAPPAALRHRTVSRAAAWPPAS